ncbi:MAG: HEAT repeat domain-containing protein, partial [Planctomycetota bacterium]
MATELARQEDAWAEALLIELVKDSASEVGQTAYQLLTKPEANRTRADIHLAALNSPRPDVRAKGCASCHRAEAAPLRTRLYELVDDERPEVHLKAIEAVDALLPDDPVPFAQALGSIFYELRVRAAELLGRRRKRDGIDAMQALLTLPETHFNRPSDALRQRATGAIADVGDPAIIPFLVSLLDEPDPIVREQAARGLATACRPDNLSPLVDALAHGDLPVRSWAAEGLARMGDVRAVPVLVGTLDHEHRPLREGAIVGLVALGPDGVRGLMQGLQDADRTLQDLALAVIVARDVALARVNLAPDLLLTALAAEHPEIR